jgi:hypothetical protein
VSIKAAQQGAHSEQNPYAKQILQEIERSYYRLVEAGLDAPYLQREISAIADWSEGTVKPKD